MKQSFRYARLAACLASIVMSAPFIAQLQAQVSAADALKKAKVLERLAEAWTPAVATACAGLVRGVVESGGTVVVPENAALLKSSFFCSDLLASPAPGPSIAYGQVPAKPGWHIMQTPTDHAVEVLTGLGATGVTVMLALVAGPPVQAHPMIPLLQVAAGNDQQSARAHRDDFDLVLEPDTAATAVLKELLRLVALAASREYSPRLFTEGSVDFQMTRGLLGVSL